MEGVSSQDRHWHSAATTCHVAPPCENRHAADSTTAQGIILFIRSGPGLLVRAPPLARNPHAATANFVANSSEPPSPQRLLPSVVTSVCSVGSVVRLTRPMEL